MKVLVIDDRWENQRSARETLAGHEVNVVSKYDDACELLEIQRADYKVVAVELSRRGFKEPDRDTPDDECRLFVAEKRRVEEELRPPSPFEAVLCDLLMPASSMTMADEGMKFVGQQMPVGFALAIMAARQGAKYVAVVTATNHHDHPASAWLDAFGSRCPNEYSRSGEAAHFTINGAKVGFYNSPPMTETGGKDWGKILSHLLKK